jgi:hypothetical protein
MAPKRSTKRKQRDGILLRYREQDSAFGVTRRTTSRIAEQLGLTETQVVHVALANLARQTLPRYEADNGPLTEEQMAEIRRRQPPGRMKEKSSLF